MARKTRRTKPKVKLTWRRLFIYFTPVIVVAFLIFNQVNGRNVLGTKDTNLLGIFGKQESGSTKERQLKQKPSCNRVTAFSASTICERSTKEKTNNAFKTYTYTCEDGTSGSLVTTQTGTEAKCMPIEKAYEMARKACNKKCKPSISPSKTPTPTPIPTEVIVE